MSEYEQGSSPTFYARFVDKNGEESIISGIPTITISHVYGEGTTIDVDHQDMGLYSGTAYQYGWNIPAGADRTTYNVKYEAVYSGVNLQSTNVKGGEEFQVITRKFYDKKGGGFVQRIKADIWTKKEKDAVIDALDRLTDGDLKSKLLSLRKDISGISKEVFGLTEGLKAVGLGVRETDLNTSTAIAGLKPYFNRIGEKLAVYSDSIKTLSEKEIDFDDTNIISKIGVLHKSVNSLGTDLRNERLTMVIAELDDLHKKFDEFEEVFAEMIPLEVKERIKNGLERTDSKEV